MMVMMMTEWRRYGCISKIFLTVFQREKEKMGFFSGCAGVMSPSQGILEALAGAEAVPVSPGNVSL